jgi:hypothetical protein
MQLVAGISGGLLGKQFLPVFEQFIIILKLGSGGLKSGNNHFFV